MEIKVEFGGGLDLLFSNQKSLQISLPAHTKTLKDLILFLRDEYVKDRPELFIQGETVRPGILVMVNDIDWELLGSLTHCIEDRDTILFISTLHGG